MQALVFRQLGLKMPIQAPFWVFPSSWKRKYQRHQTQRGDREPHTILASAERFFGLMYSFAARRRQN